MGADGRFPYPKDVWSPGGGWWPHPKAWRGNTAIGVLLVLGLTAPVFIYSERNMTRVGDGANVRIPWRPEIPVRKD